MQAFVGFACGLVLSMTFALAILDTVRNVGWLSSHAHRRLRDGFARRAVPVGSVIGAVLGGTLEAVAKERVLAWALAVAGLAVFPMLLISRSARSGAER